MKFEIRQFKIADRVVTSFFISAEKNKDYKYVYDPDHKHRPSGGGWTKTEKGWTDKKEKTNGRGNQTEKGNHLQGHDVFGRLQKAGLCLSEKVSKLFHSGSRQIDDGIRGRLSGILRGELRTRSRRSRYGNEVFVNPKTKKPIKFYSGVDSKTFVDCFSACRQFLKNGDCVDIHEEKDYKDTNNYISEDGLQGFSITSNGDLISVFSISNGGFLKTIAPFIKNNVKTLDCFESTVQPLARMYNKVFGFQTASVLDYNKSFQIEEKGKEYADYFEKKYKSPSVHFMVNPQKLDKSTQSKYYDKNGNVKQRHFDKNDWEGAYFYRESLINNTEKAKGNETK